MSMQRRNLADEQIELALRARVADPPPILLDEILTAASAAPQLRSYRRLALPANRRVVIVLAAAVMLAVLAGALALALFFRLPALPRNGEVLVEYNCGLSLIRTTDGQARELVPPIAGCAAPARYAFLGPSMATSSDGHTLAYSTGCSACDSLTTSDLQSLGVWLIDVTSGNARQLASCEPKPGQCLTYLDLSQDGRRIAYGTWDGLSATTSIVLSATDGHDGQTVLLPAVATGLAWAPDGRSLAVTTTSFLPGGGLGPAHLYSVSSSGGEAVDELEMQDTQLSRPIWSPNGQQIMIQAAATDRSESILIVGGNGAAARQVASSASSDVLLVEPVGWSSDNARISYLMAPMGSTDLHGELHVLDLQSGADTVIYRSSGPACCSGIGPATWSPDGRWLALGIQNPDAQTGLFLIHPDGSGLRRITSLTEHVLTWLPAR